MEDDILNKGIAFQESKHFFPVKFINIILVNVF